MGVIICLIATGLLVAAPIVCWFSDDDWKWKVVLAAGEILEIIGAGPVLISELFCK